MTIYAFIDGPFLTNAFKSFANTFASEGFNLSYSLTNICGEADRVFYYDALPDESDTVDFAANKRRLQEIGSSNRVLVRTAKTRRGAKSKREQKGVDVLLAVDCLEFSLKQSIRTAAIYTSDLDFFPLLEALQRTPTKTMLRYERGRANPDLVMSSDHSSPIAVNEFLQCCAQKGVKALYETPTSPATPTGRIWRINHRDFWAEIREFSSNGSVFYERYDFRQGTEIVKGVVSSFRSNSLFLTQQHIPVQISEPLEWTLEP